MHTTVEGVWLRKQVNVFRRSSCVCRRRRAAVCFAALSEPHSAARYMCSRGATTPPPRSAHMLPHTSALSDAAFTGLRYKRWRAADLLLNSCGRPLSADPRRQSGVTRWTNNVNSTGEQPWLSSRLTCHMDQI